MIIEIIGVISFSAAGAMVAIDKETDFFGVIILSAITSPIAHDRQKYVSAPLRF